MLRVTTKQHRTPTDSLKEGGMYIGTNDVFIDVEDGGADHYQLIDAGIGGVGGRREGGETSTCRRHAVIIFINNMRGIEI